MTVNFSAEGIQSLIASVVLSSSQMPGTAPTQYGHSGSSNPHLIFIQPYSIIISHQH